MNSQYGGTKTEKNLVKAFSGESEARNRYTFYASKARKEGYKYIAEEFERTAANEKEHAKLWLKELEGIGDTVSNLLISAENEHAEWSKMYKEMEKDAREERFFKMADMFAAIAEIEKSHEARYRMLLSHLEDGKWECTNCGHIFEGAVPPEICPVCSHPREYFDTLR